MNAVNVSYYHNTDKMIQAKSKLKAKITDQPPPPPHTHNNNNIYNDNNNNNKTRSTHKLISAINYL